MILKNNEKLISVDEVKNKYPNLFIKIISSLRASKSKCKYHSDKDLIWFLTYCKKVEPINFSDINKSIDLYFKNNETILTYLCAKVKKGRWHCGFNVEEENNV